MSYNDDSRIIMNDFDFQWRNLQVWMVDLHEAAQFRLLFQRLKKDTDVKRCYKATLLTNEDLPRQSSS